MLHASVLRSRYDLSPRSQWFKCIFRTTLIFLFKKTYRFRKTSCEHRGQMLAIQRNDDFYLASEMESVSYSEDWHIYYPQ